MPRGMYEYDTGRMSEEEIAQLLRGELPTAGRMDESEEEHTAKKKKPHKYRAKPVELDGHRFDSTAEAIRYTELKLMAASGAITDLELQPEYILVDGFVDWRGKRLRPIRYIADFRYMQDGELRVEDVKGVATPVFRLKLKLFKAKYPNIAIYVVQIKNGRTRSVVPA